MLRTPRFAIFYNDDFIPWILSLIFDDLFILLLTFFFVFCFVIRFIYNFVHIPAYYVAPFVNKRQRGLKRDTEKGICEDIQHIKKTTVLRPI